MRGGETTPQPEHGRATHNRHHAFFPRLSYKTPMQRELRLTPAFIILGPAEWHKELHAHVMPPPMLTNELSYHLLDHVEGSPLGSTAGLEAAVGFFRDMQESPRLAVADLSHIAYEALSQQLYYLSGHYREGA